MNRRRALGVALALCSLVILLLAIAGYFASRILPGQPGQEKPAQTFYELIKSGRDASAKEIFHLLQGGLHRRAVYERSPLYRVVQDGKWGFIDRQGRLVIAPQFEEAGDFHVNVYMDEPLAKVRVGQESHCINSAGRVSSQRPSQDPQAYQPCSPIIKSYASYNSSGWGEGLQVKQEGQLWGYADQGGTFVIAPRFDEAKVFNQGLAPVRIGAKWGYVDSKATS